MNSIKCLLDMIYTEAITGISEDHYFDEYRNREFIPPKSEKIYQQLP